MNPNPEAPRLLQGSNVLEFACGEHIGMPVLLGAIGSDPDGLWATPVPGWRKERGTVDGRNIPRFETRHEARPWVQIPDNRYWEPKCKCGERKVLSPRDMRDLIDGRDKVMAATRKWFTLPDKADTHFFTDEAGATLPVVAIQVVSAYLRSTRKTLSYDERYPNRFS